MYDYDSILQEQLIDNNIESSIPGPELNEENGAEDDLEKETADDLFPKESTPATFCTPSEFLLEFSPVIQFCHLCAKGKILPVLYTLASSKEIQDWFTSISPSIQPIVINDSRHSLDITVGNDEDSKVSSPERKMSRKDHYFINTMLKLHDTMDKNTLRQSLEKEEKEPGFNRLESYRKNLILNASATPPFDIQASKPTEFYNSFLSKKSQFKAKEMILHCFQLDKVAFNPSTTFISNLWSSDFFWILPDSPSGVSIFFCPETKSINATELEKEQNFALADKVKAGDKEKLSKQKLYLPNSIMDLVWMTQNFLAVISLCFGKSSLSASFLKDWADHMYENRLIYTSLQASDPSFFTKVLFAIDNSLYPLAFLFSN
jgi:hypothetical protein